MNEVIYVTGHRKPDTDSIVSAIAYARLKNKTGLEAVPCRLGKLSPETRFLLERFGVSKPMLLKDARFCLGEMDLDDPVVIRDTDTIFTALNVLENSGRSSAAVVNADGELAGILSYRDLAKVGLRDTALGIDLIRHTSLENIAQTINGRILHRASHSFNGKVSIVAVTENNVLDYEVRDRIVIAGDDEKAQLTLIEKGAALLILVWCTQVSDRVLEKARRKGCSIILSGYGGMNTSRYLYFSPPVHLLMKKEVRCFHEMDLAEDVLDQMKNLRFRTYPVVDESRHVVGYVDRYHILRCENKKLILVDHNEFSQSVPGVEKARVLEVIDHHRVAGFFTTSPVNMRCETVGCTATIITKIYRERMIQIDGDIAGLLLGAILSDTLKFASPTTTQEDIFAAVSLAQIAGLNIDEFAHEMFSVTTDITCRSVKELLMQDVKDFEILDSPFRISQSIVYDLQDIEERQEEIEQELTAQADSSHVTCVAAFTSILQKGSCFFVSGPQKKLVEQVYAPGQVYEKVLSRKNQILPAITMALSDVL